MLLSSQIPEWQIASNPYGKALEENPIDFQNLGPWHRGAALTELCPPQDTFANCSKTSSRSLMTLFHPSCYLDSSLMASNDSDNNGQVLCHPAGAQNRAGWRKKALLVKHGGANDSPQVAGSGLREKAKPRAIMQACRTLLTGSGEDSVCPLLRMSPTHHKPRISLPTSDCVSLSLWKKPKLDNRECRDNW